MQVFVTAFVVSTLSTDALRANQISVGEDALDDIELYNVSIDHVNPGSQLGKTVQRTVQTGLRNAKVGNALKGFQFKAKPNGLLRNGFHAKPPSHAFGGVRNQFGRGFSTGFGRGVGNGFSNQFGRGPGRMPTVAKRFASGNAQLLPKNVHILGFENLQNNLREPILKAVGFAAEHASSPFDIAKCIRESAWHIFKGFAHNDVHVLVSRSEVQIGKAAKDFVGRFKIQKGGKDLYVTIIKRSEFAPPFKKAVNYGIGRSDRDLLRSFGRGLYFVRNIFQSESLHFMRQKVGDVLQSGLSEAGMARQLESLIQQKWGRGWNIVVSKTEMQIATNVNDIMANFKVNDIFFTIIRQMA